MENNSSPGSGPRFHSEPNRLYKISLSQPDEIVRHDISDEELQMLSDLKRNWMMEAFWGFLGAALGAAKGGFSALFTAYGEGKASPMPTGDLFEVILFFVCFALGGLLLVVSLSRSSRTGKLVNKIRDRKRKE